MADGPRNIQAVTALVQDILSGRKFEGLIIGTIEYVFFPSAYVIPLTWEGKKVTIKVPAELIDDTLNNKDLFHKRKIKKMIKSALGMGQDNDD